MKNRQFTFNRDSQEITVAKAVCSQETTEKPTTTEPSTDGEDTPTTPGPKTPIS
jgi:hypothetical protein